MVLKLEENEEKENLIHKKQKGKGAKRTQPDRQQTTDS